MDDNKRAALNEWLKAAIALGVCVVIILVLWQMGWIT